MAPKRKQYFVGFSNLNTLLLLMVTGFGLGRLSPDLLLAAPALSDPSWPAVPALRAQYAQTLAQAEAPAAARSLAQLGLARSYAWEGDWTTARAEYEKALVLPDIPAHHRWEAEQALQEIGRRLAGQPARFPGATRVQREALPAPRQTLHVSPKGSDANPGTARKPFATLGRARDQLRVLKQQGGLSGGGAVIVVHGGEYPVHETLTLSAADSGTASDPIVYRAPKGEQPIFRGGIRLGKPAPVTAAGLHERLTPEVRAKVVQFDLKAAGITNVLPLKLGGFASGNGFRTHPAHELFFNGRALQLARGPNEGFLRVKDVAVKDGTKGYDREGTKVGQFFYGDDRPDRWAKEPDLLLYGYWFWDWADSYERVASIDTERRRIDLAKPWHTYGFSVGAPFYAINALSELDQPGEWYLDRASLTVVLYPPAEPKSATVELSILAGPMLELKEVSHVHFEGLTWELGAADAIHVSGGERCVFAGCTVRRFAGNGVSVRGGASHGLLSCDIYSLGRGGTVISGGDRKTLAPGRHYLENCDIHELSRIDHTYTPAVLLEGVGNRIAHNRFHDIASSAMRVEGNDHVIEYNEIFRAVQESDDQGGADLFGNPTYRGNVFRYNYWHHIGNWQGIGEHPKCGQAGIRLDDAISGTVIYGNVFERCSAGKLGFGGVQIHGGKENLVDNNVFLDCAAALSFSPWDDKRWREFVRPALSRPEIDAALYLQRYPALAQLSENANRNHVWRNVAVRCGELLRRPPKNLDVLQNTLTAESNLRLSPDSALLNRPDLAPIPFAEIGLYSDAYRRLK
jgi:hypothetical protein